MNRVSKGFYLTAILGGYVLAGVLAGIGAAMSIGVTDASQLGPVFGLLALSAVPAIFGVVVFLVLLYKCWAQIQDGHATTTPGLAVGLLFIPLFNLYWIFRAFHSYSKDYNAYLDRHAHTTAEKLPEGLFLAFCILSLAGIVPVVNGIAGLINIVVFIMMLSRMIDSINALPEPAVTATQAA